MNAEYEKIRPYLADDGQLCRARLARLEEGSARGQRIVDVDNGSGLAFTVTPDRGMNLVECSFQGIPIAFRTPCGHRAATGNWLGDWTGGLVTGCGLHNVGSPSGGHGLHGAISGESAEQLSIVVEEGEIAVGGVLREGALFGANLALCRSIRTGFRRNVIEIDDLVRNRSECPQFIEMLYHCNFGYPLVSPELEFDAPEHEITRRDTAAEAEIGKWCQYPVPLSGFNEHCFLHKLVPAADGWAAMRIVNRPLGIAVRLEYDTASLPILVQWKKPSLHGYVLGLEPTDGSLNGCEFDREHGYGALLPPGAARMYRIRLVFETLA